MGGKLYEFGPFRLDPSEQLLLRENEPIALAPKAFDLLVALISCHGHLVTREKLMQTVWPDSFVEETNLTVNISLLRKILGCLPDGQPWIATVPKRGYRFDGRVMLYGEGGGLPELVAAAPVTEKIEPAVADSEAPPVTVATVEAPAARRRFGVRRWMYSAAGTLAIAFLIWVSVHVYGLRHSGQLASVHTLAVLPFATAGVTSEDQYLGIGLTDALITRLGRLSQIVVRPIGAVRGFQGVSDPTSAGRKLDVQAVLNGTVQRVGDRTRVAVRLERVSDGIVLWSENFEEQNSSDFQIEDSISQQLAKALALRLRVMTSSVQLATPNTPNSQAYELYIQGRYNWNKRSVESVQKSIDLFRQATDVDPNYAAAWSGLSDAWILAGSYGNSFLSPIAMPKAKEAAEQALALDPFSAEAHTSLAYIHFMWDWYYAGAEQEFRRAIAINPGYVNAHHWYSHELIALGRVAESHEQSETALALDPSDVVINEHMAWHHMMTREYQRSIPQANKAVELDPNFVQARRVLGLDLLYSEGDRASCEEFKRESTYPTAIRWPVHTWRAATP